MELIEFLQAHESETASLFVEKANYRRENRIWLKLSRYVALQLVQYMQSNDLNQKSLAERLELSPQYVSRLLSGRTNLSFKSLATLEAKLGLKIFL